MGSPDFALLHPGYKIGYEAIVTAPVGASLARRSLNFCLHPSAKASLTTTVGLPFDCRNVSFEIQLNMIEIRETEEFKA